MAGPSPAQWLMSTPRGAYTTLLARQGRGLVDWPTHVQRLLRSLRALHAALGCYSAYYSWMEEQRAGGAEEGEALQRLMAPAIRSALAAAQQAEAAADATSDQLLVLVLPPGTDGQACGLDVRALATPCGAPDTSPGTAVVLGGPRSVAEAKDSGWVAERQPLERLRPPGTADVLLCSSDGRLLEGLVTNLFVVTIEGGSSRGAEPGSSSNGTGNSAGGSSGALPPGAVVWTAGVGEGVVWGTARARVLEACRQLGLAVREEAPSAGGRATWREAFLTNSVRLVQPLRAVECGAGNVWGAAPWRVELPAAPGPVTAALHSALLRLLPTTAVEQLPTH